MFKKCTAEEEKKEYLKADYKNVYWCSSAAGS